ncbi:MAG: Gldg family protein [Acidobacteriota bacterium]
MLDRKNLRVSLLATLVLVALNLVALNTLMASWPWLRLDLTEEGVYSITPATRRLLGSLDENVLVTGYFSKRTHPKLAPLVPQIEDLLDEYRAISKGRVQVEIVDPGQDAAAEQEATDRFGVESTPFRLASKYESGIVNAYFALVVRYGDQYVRYGFDDLIEVERLPDGDVDVRLRNLEYDLTRAIKKVVYGFRSTAELFGRMESPVRFISVMTPGTLPDLLKDIPEAVRSAAAELEKKGGDRFEYEEIDPSTDESKKAAVTQRFGVRPMSMGLFSNASFYLYGFLEVEGRMEQIVLVKEGVTAAAVREDIENAMRRQAPGFLKTVGISAPGANLPPEVMAQLQMQGRMQQPPPEFDQVKKYLGQDYKVTDTDLDAKDGIPSNVDTLLVLKPRNLSERAIYNLDQYLMRGGRLIICAGKYETRFGQGDLRVMPVDSGLDDWLKHFGVQISNTLVLDDRNQPLPIPEVRRTVLGNIRTWVMKPYPYLVEVREDGLVNREVGARLESVGIYWGSPITLDQEATKGMKTIELLRSSDRSWTSDDLDQVRYADYKVPEQGTESRLLAVALSGRFKSYFADKAPPGAEDSSGTSSGDAAAGEEEKLPSWTEVPLKESPETRLVVVGDAAFLSDFVASALGRATGGFFTQNLAFAQNLIDWTNLDNDMISIRARGGGARRMDRISRGTEVAIEAVNYMIPALVLILLASYRLWQRRHAVPEVVAGLSRPGTTRHASQEV